jgi:hypothetical protein
MSKRITGYRLQMNDIRAQTDIHLSGIWAKFSCKIKNPNI